MSVNDPMPQAHDLAETFEEAMERFRATLDDTRRHWAAFMVTEYPHRDVLERAANKAVQELEAQAVEINALYDGKQVTVMQAPKGLRATVPDTSSLCALTVGAGHPLAVDDLQTDPITAHHPGRQLWSSWASVPLLVDGIVAGTVCALESHARRWNGRDQACLEKIAADLSKQISEWADAAREERR